MVTSTITTLKLSELTTATLPLTDDVYIIGLQEDANGNPVDVKMARRDILSGKTQNWLGEWDETVDYVPYDCVSYNGSSYIAVDVNSDSRPDLDTSVWNIFASRGSQGVDGNLSDASLATINDAIAQANTAVTNSQGNAAAANASATAANTSANTASQHAQEGATYANQSQTNANAALASATSASASAMSSASGANAVAGYMKEFRALFLGSFSADPQTDGNGAALVAGAIYLNTDSNKLRTYSGTDWADYDQGVQDVQVAASNSAVAAANSESNAAISETNASNSASTAATQASTAATQAATATSAATQASTAASSAVTSANQTSALATTLNSTVARFLGISATAPTARSDGTALVVGDYYTDGNTPANTFVYSAQGWLAFATISDLLGAKYQSDFTGAASRISSWKLYEFTSILDYAPSNKPGDTWDATAALTALNALSTRKIYLPRGIYKVTSNITLTGIFVFESGAMLQPASGKVVTFSKAKIVADNYDQIFDYSASGTVTGTIKGRLYSVCWWGVDITGTAVAGAAVQNALNAKLTSIAYFPAGTYNITGTQVAVNGVSLYGDERSNPILNYLTDAGSTACAMSVINCSYMENINLNGPGGNGGVAYGATKVNMEGMVLGGFGSGGSSQTKFKNCTFGNFHFGCVINTLGGHVLWDTCHWSGNYASLGVWQTGGDYTFLNCDSQVERVAAIYLPQNGTLGVNFNITNWYYRQTPWFIVQDSVSDTRSPLTQGTTNSVCAGGCTWTGINGELIGQGFMNLLPTDSSFSGLLMFNCGWASGNSAYSCTTGNFTRTDYTICAAYLFRLRFEQPNNAVLFPQPGTAGVCVVTNGSSFILFRNLRVDSRYTNKTYVTGTGQSWFYNEGYISPYFQVASGATTATYTMTEAEKCSSAYHGYIVGVYGRTGLIPNARVTISGYTVTVTFASALTAATYITLDILGRPQ